MNRGHGILDSDSQSILMYGMIGLVARITSTEMPWNFKDGSILVYLDGASTTFQISEMKFH